MVRYRVQNAAFGTGRPGRLAAVGTILTDDLAPGTRYVLVAAGSGEAGVRRLTSAGVYLDTFATGISGGFNPNTGVCFAPDGKVLATRFGQDAAGARLFSRHGALLIGNFGAQPGLFFNSHESCVYDAAGNVYIGQAGFNAQQTDAQVPVLKFDRNGQLLDRFVVPTGTRGTDWIELSADQCTLYYTSEDTTVRRYNLCTRTALPPLITTLTPPFCYALRLRPNSELMVACQDAVHRVSPEGVNLQTYTRQSIGETNAQGLFALNLDPDGTSFWTAGALSGMVYPRRHRQRRRADLIRQRRLRRRLGPGRLRRVVGNRRAAGRRFRVDHHGAQVDGGAARCHRSADGPGSAALHPARG